MKSTLSRIFSEIIRETETNASFRKRLEDVLQSSVSTDQSKSPRSTLIRRHRNKRTPAILDPYEELSRGEQYLRARLATLSIDQLKDIVSEQALDSSRVALKWNKPDRLIDLIVTTVRSRLEKGDAFRN